MFRALIAASSVLELGGGAGVIVGDFPSRLFSLSAHAITLGLVCMLVAVSMYRRQSVEAAFDLGVEVGERRGRRSARPVLVQLLNDEKILAGRHEQP